MNDALDSIFASELFDAEWSLAYNDKPTAIIPTPSISPELLTKPHRTEVRLQDLGSQCSQGPTPPSHPLAPALTELQRENLATSTRQYTSPSSNPGSVRQQKAVMSPREDKQKTRDLDDKHEETDSEELERLNKHRAINRKTAAKARQRDKIQTAALEKAFEDESTRNPILKRTIVSLHEELYHLQMEALGHGNCNCAEVQTYNQKRARKISQCWELGQSD